MQTRANAEIDVYSGEFGNQVIRYTKYKTIVKTKIKMQINKQGLGRIRVKNKGCRIQYLYKLAYA